MEKNFKGLWGKPTSTIDWCESNYEVSYYVAEFWNTLSNLLIIVLTVAGFHFARRDALERRYLVSHLALLGVGLGSVLFHGTLRFGGQLMDEIPMIYMVACLVYVMREVAGPPNASNKTCILTLGITCVVLTLVYMTMNTPLVFQVCFGTMVLVSFYYSVQIVRKHKHSRLLYTLAIALYTTGFILWICDQIFCPRFKSMRKSFGYPLKPLFQGHAWWHLLAMTGSYFYLLFSTHARNCYLKREPKLEMRWRLVPIVTVQRKAILPQ